MISIVIPCYNEEQNITILWKEIFNVCRENNINNEIIFIDDGSTDNTFGELKKIPGIKIIKFRKNFGQTASLDAGFKIAQGDVIITMDGDLQNDPKEIPNLIKAMDDGGFDVVSGWRKRRNDQFSKRLLSSLANILRKFLINDDINDSGCTLKAYKKECLVNLNLYGEMHRFIPAVLKLQGFKIGEIEVNHRARKYGKTKYNWKRTIKGSLDLINIWFWKKYLARPLHLFGSLGILLIFLGTIFGSYVIYLKIFENVDMSDNALTIISAFLLLSGLNFLISGIMSDILIKNYYQNSPESPYYIKEIIET